MVSPAPASPLSSASTWDLVSPAYTEEIAPLFESFATRALDLVPVPVGGRVVDVAAGPGTLSFLAAARGLSVAAIDFSAPMIAQLVARAARDGTTAVEAVVGDGMKLPWADASFDGGFSMFGLMFFPHRETGFRELSRVLKPGAWAVVSSWTDLAADPVLSRLFAKLGELLGHPSGPRSAFPLTTAASCLEEMGAGGRFVDVSVVEHAILSTAPSPAAFVAHIVRSNAMVALIKQGMGASFEPIQDGIVQHLVRELGEGEVQVTMRANLIVGRRPAH